MHMICGQLVKHTDRPRPQLDCLWVAMASDQLQSNAARIDASSLGPRNLLDEVLSGPHDVLCCTRQIRFDAHSFAPLPVHSLPS